MQLLKMHLNQWISMVLMVSVIDCKTRRSKNKSKRLPRAGQPSSYPPSPSSQPVPGEILNKILPLSSDYPVTVAWNSHQACALYGMAIAAQNRELCGGGSEDDYSTDFQGLVFSTHCEPSNDHTLQDATFKCAARFGTSYRGCPDAILNAAFRARPFWAMWCPVGKHPVVFRRAQKFSITKCYTDQQYANYLKAKERQKLKGKQQVAEEVGEVEDAEGEDEPLTIEDEIERQQAGQIALMLSFSLGDVSIQEVYESAAGSSSSSKHP